MSVDEAKRDRWLALSASAGGLAGATVAAMGSRSIGGSNYMAEGFASALLIVFALAVVGFWVGAYLGAGVFWIGSARERDVSPGLVATGALFGAWLGQTMAWLTLGWLFMRLEAASPFGALLGALPGAWLGARLGARVRRPKWASREARLGHVGLLVALVLGGAWAGVPRPSFPGAAAPAAERRAWALETFGTSYQAAETFLKASPGVRERLGAVRAMAPVEGPNRTAYSPGELMGEFTIGVEGERETGVARLRFMDGGDGYRFSGTLKHEGVEVLLGAP